MKPIKTLKTLGEVIQMAVDRAERLYKKPLDDKACPGVIIYDKDGNEYEIFYVSQTSLLPDIEIRIRKIVEPTVEPTNDCPVHRDGRRRT